MGVSVLKKPLMRPSLLRFSKYSVFWQKGALCKKIGRKRDRVVVLTKHRFELLVKIRGAYYALGNLSMLLMLAGSSS